MNRPSVAVVIVTFNRLDKLKTAYRSIADQAVAHIVVVDNCSTDGTPDWLEANKRDNTSVLVMPQNLGGAGGFHVGFKYAVEEIEADWVLCFDDDAYADAELIERFGRLELGPEVGGVACAVFLPDGGIARMNRPGRNPFHSLKLLAKTATNGSMGFHLTDEEFTQHCEIDFCSFVGLFVRVPLIKSEVGLPRKELFIYADDLFFTLDIRRCGYKILFNPDLKFIHDTDTLVQQKKIYSPLWKAYYTYRNALLVYKRTSGFLFPLILFAKLAGWFINTKEYPNKRKYLQITLLAIKDSLKKDFSRPHKEVLAMSKEP